MSQKLAISLKCCIKYREIKEFWKTNCRCIEEMKRFVKLFKRALFYIDKHIENLYIFVLYLNTMQKLLLY